MDNKIKQTTSDSLHVNNLFSSYNPMDSVAHLLNLSIAKDTFEYQAFYNDNSPYELLYFKTGNLLSSKMKHAIALYTINDTTVLCELYCLADSKWTKSSSNISMHIDGFSPAYFNAWFDDYNFDGFRDLNIIFYNSMSVADSYGYILTYSKPSNSLILHPETIEIPSIEIDKKSKTITSTEYSNPNRTIEKYKIISSFRWINDTLKLFSENKYKLK